MIYIYRSRFKIILEIKNLPTFKNVKHLPMRHYTLKALCLSLYVKRYCFYSSSLFLFFHLIKNTLM